MGDEGRPVCRADGTGMLTAPYSILQLPGLTMGINCLPIAQIGKLVQRGLAHAKMTQHVSVERKFAHVKLVPVLVAKLLPAQGQGLDPACGLCPSQRALRNKGRWGSAHAARTTASIEDCSMSLGCAFPLSGGVGDSRS